MVSAMPVGSARAAIDAVIRAISAGVVFSSRSLSLSRASAASAAF